MTSCTIPTQAINLTPMAAPRTSAAARLLQLLRQWAARPAEHLPDRLLDDVDPGRRSVGTSRDLDVRLGRWLY